MPQELFYELDIDKKKRIINAGLREFAHHDYSHASTNEIVKKAIISKGSLYKYFTNKEDFYFYILDYIVDDLVKELEDSLPKINGDIFEVIFQYAKVEFNWHIKNPDKYQLLKRAFIDDSSNMYRKTVERYKLVGDNFYYKLLENVNTEELRWEKEKTLNILKWTLEGFNECFTKKIGLYSDIKKIKDCYVKELKEYMDILREGIYK